MSKSHLSITQAGITSLFVAAVGQVVAFVPSFGPDKQNLISAGSAVIAAAFLLANSIHKLADSNVSAKDVETGAINAARSEIGKVDFTALVNQAVSTHGPADLEALIESKARQVISGLLGQAASSVPVAAPPPAVAGAQPLPVVAEPPAPVA